MIDIQMINEAKMELLQIIKLPRSQFIYFEWMKYDDSACNFLVKQLKPNLRLRMSSRISMHADSEGKDQMTES